MKNFRFVILSAENPNGISDTNYMNDMHTGQLRKELDLLGYKHQELKGCYGGIKEISFIIWNVPVRIALGLRKRFNQESILVPAGLLYKSLQINPAVHPNCFELIDDDDNYTEMNGLKFRMDIDFSKKIVFNTSMI